MRYRLTRRRQLMRYLLTALMLLLAGRAAATGEINVLTDLKSPFPPGCVAVALPPEPASSDNTLWDVNVDVPSVGSPTRDARMRVTIWRVGCPDPGFSVVMVRLQRVSGSGPVIIPRVFAEAGEVDLPMHKAQLIRHPAVGDVGASGDVLNQAPITYMLAVDPFALQGDGVFTPADYNDTFTLEFFWGHYASGVIPEAELFTIDGYVPALDPPQFEFPALHGRMSGQYTIDGIPFTGLVLQVGEAANDTNSVTAIFFTYFEGFPFWVIGTAGNLPPGLDQVELEMLELYGGEFFSAGPGSFDENDVAIASVGTLIVEVLDCKRLLLGYDFTEGGLGSGVLEVERLIRMAGYDCNPWE